MTLINAEIRQLRADMGLGREKFAPLFGVTAETIRRWEAGDQPDHPAAIMALIREIRKEKGL